MKKQYKILSFFVMLIGLLFSILTITSQLKAYTPSKYPINTSVINGTITASNSYDTGSSPTITYVANEGFVLKEIMLDGISIDITQYSSSYTFENLNDTHNLSVIYEPESIDYSGFSLNMYGYCSDIGNGNTNSNNLNLNMSSTSDSKQLKFQINYTNQSTTKEYAPGELIIKVKDVGQGLKTTDTPFYGTVGYHYKEWQVSADLWSEANKQYEFSYMYVEPKFNPNTELFENGYFVFVNNNTINGNKSFAGSIQITCPVTYLNTINNANYNVNATMGDIVTNNINVSLTIDLKTYPLSTYKYVISSYDGLGENADQYTWVKTLVRTNNNTGVLPFVYHHGKIKITTNDPNIRVIGGGSQYPSYQDGNSYYFDVREYLYGFSHSYQYIYIGYPKSTYNNKTVSQKIELIGTYHDVWYNWYDSSEIYSNLGIVLDDYKTQPVISTVTQTTNLSSFNFTYTGELYGIGYGSNNKYNISQNRLITEGANATVGAKATPDVFFNGTTYNIRFGLDASAITTNTGIRLLDEDEYCFDYSCTVNLRNKNGTQLPSNKYTCNLYIKRRGEDYTLYETWIYDGSKYITFDDYSSYQKDIVGIYLEVLGLQEGLLSNGSYGAYLSSDMRIFNVKDAAQTGNFYGFSWMDVYTENNGIETILNTVDLTNYNSNSAKTLLANYDMQNYGHYVQRGMETIPYNEEVLATRSELDDDFYKVGTLDNERKVYTKTMDISYGEYGSSTYTSTWFTGYDYYLLLPKGVELASDPNEMLKGYANWSSKDVYQKLASGTKITIHENWNNSNQTMIHILSDFRDSPVMIGDETSLNYLLGDPTFYFRLKLDVPYNSIKEYGNTYELKSWLYHLSNDAYPVTFMCLDSGTMNTTDTNDINNNGNYDEKNITLNKTFTITTAIESYQDVQIQVSSDQTGMSISSATASLGSTYSYRLITRTGINKVTNLILYNNLETAFDNNKYWQGTLSSIDTTYATSQGYNVKIWYSTNASAGNLYNENGTINTNYTQYTTTTNNSTVKTLAFEYLDSNGNPAILPADEYTYIIINMTAPTSDLKTKAYNQCRTEWTALDDTGIELDGIIGLYSNIVEIRLPNSLDFEPFVSLVITEEIIGTSPDFENIILNKSNEKISQITLLNLMANNNGTHNQISGLLSSTQGLVINNIPIGTYLISTSNDTYFDFVEFVENNNSENITENVTFEKTDQGYILNISEDLAEVVEFNIKITNKIEDERFYESKEYKKNFFLKE